MATSASQYYAQAQEYKNNVNYYTERRNSYSTYKDKLVKFKNNIFNSQGYMENAHNNFKNGGYITDGVSLDEENLTRAIDLLNQSVEQLQNIISKTAMMIEDFDEKISKYDRLYNQAYDNYIKARNQE